MSRERQREAQARLMQSLVYGKEAPEGFDASRVEACGQSLRLKRMRAALRCCPPGLEAGFEEYAEEHPLRDGGPIADAYRYQRYLFERGRLPDTARASWLVARFRFRDTSAGLARRVLPGLLVARVPGGVLLALRFGLCWVRLVRA